jgi:hypothetical protein
LFFSLFFSGPSCSLTWGFRAGLSGRASELGNWGSPRGTWLLLGPPNIWAEPRGLPSSAQRLSLAGPGPAAGLGLHGCWGWAVISWLGWAGLLLRPFGLDALGAKLGSSEPLGGAGPGQAIQLHPSSQDPFIHPSNLPSFLPSFDASCQ